MEPTKTELHTGRLALRLLCEGAPMALSELTAALEAQGQTSTAIEGGLRWLVAEALVATTGHSPDASYTATAKGREIDGTLRQE